MAEQQGESLYEETNLYAYENTRLPRTYSTTPQPVDKTLASVPKEKLAKSCNNAWIFFACLCLLGIVNSALLSVVLTKQMKAEERKLLETCLELRQKGEENSGIHKIQQSQENVPIEVFCDMETDGGGWSLVASIHESDINAKCSTDDRWSVYVPGNFYTGKSTWENEMTFGDVRNSLFDDYKSSAYHRMKASDVMIWQIPSGISINLARNQSKLRYRTTNKFLRNYGGNMKNLYNRYFPLSTPLPNLDNTATVLKGFIASLSVIKYTSAGWYNYQFHQGSRQVTDTGMYSSSGNRVNFRNDGWSHPIEYGREYRHLWISETCAVSGITSPFTFLAAIMNDLRKIRSYDITVHSNRSPSSTVISKFENTTTLGNFSLHYHAIQFYESDKSLHTECRLHFYISNEKEWMSIPPTWFNVSSENIYGNYKMVAYRINGHPSRVLFGYMLLSRRSGLNYTATDLNEIAETILERLSVYSNLMDEWKDTQSLVVPVTFDRGTESTVFESTPPDMRRFTQAGNLQFRASNYKGYSNALCPGVSVRSISPEYVCVGGVSGDITRYGTCGDFAGWGGIVGERINPVNATGHAHSSVDVTSTLLIFYR